MGSNSAVCLAEDLVPDVVGVADVLVVDVVASVVEGGDVSISDPQRSFLR